MSKFLVDQNQDWSVNDIEKISETVEKIGVDEWGLSIYPNSIDIISSEQMIDMYTSIGMPIYYNHWSFGKDWIKQNHNYKKGNSGLALELVINSDPCINYIMEDNDLLSQLMVLAHSSVGHNFFFKNNYLFKEETDASAIVDYLLFARNYIQEQERIHGTEVVERWIDSCHALSDYGINRYRRPSKLSFIKERDRLKNRIEYELTHKDEYKSIIPDKKKDNLTKSNFEPQENLLYFFEKHSPKLASWQREIIRIVRKISAYFSPQGMTKVMNEGTATWVHYTMMNLLHDRGTTTDGAHLSFLQLHSSVIFQPEFDKSYYRGFNPYKLGFEIFRDIERICKNPTEEDLRWLPNLQGSDFLTVFKEIVANYRDESFIRQWMTPKVMRDLKMFVLYDDKDDIEYEVKQIHNEKGYQEIRNYLADSYERDAYIPILEVVNVDWDDRILTIRHTPYKNRDLKVTNKLLYHLKKLWSGYTVRIDNERGIKIDEM